MLLAILLIALFGSSMFYTVGIDEIGMVQRFGKQVRTGDPGLNFKFPRGIEKVTKIKRDRIYVEEFGIASDGTINPARTRFITENEQSVNLMLTGDLNVAVVPWIVQYRIKDPYNFMFKVEDVIRLLRDLSESSMRLVVGDRSINEVISKRQEIATQAATILQAELDTAESGIHIVTVELKRTNVPEKVQPSFNEVNQAIQERERLIYQARENYNKDVPAAIGEAERVIRAAEGYAFNRVNRAQGDAARFTAIYHEYEQAKDITRRRMYLEMIEKLFPEIEQKYIIDADQKSVLPFLNLGNQIGLPK